MEQSQRDRMKLLGAGILFEGGLGGLAWGLGWLLGYPIAEKWTWSAGAVLAGIAICVPMVGLFLAFVRWPVGPLARLYRITCELICPRFATFSILDLAVLSLFAGVGEELLFRGFLQDWLGGRIGVGSALIITSLLFGLMHPITATYILLAGLVGAYMGIITLATGNVLPAAVAHGLYDFFALVYLTRRRGVALSP